MGLKTYGASGLYNAVVAVPKTTWTKVLDANLARVSLRIQLDVAGGSASPKSSTILASGSRVYLSTQAESTAYSGIMIAGDYWAALAGAPTVYQTDTWKGEIWAYVQGAVTPIDILVSEVLK